MAVDKKQVEYHLKVIDNPNYQFNDSYKLCFLTPESYNIIDNSISYLRSIRYFKNGEHYSIREIFKYYKSNYYKIKKLNYEQPRIIAQKFIGKKNIRKFIFERDFYSCLKCNSKEKLQLDHIIPISKGGKNKLSNLQTLCASCNSKKRDNYKDYRNGAR